MSSYNLLGRKIEFSKAEDDFYELQSFLWESSHNFENEYVEWYKAQGTILNVLNNEENFITQTMEKIVLTPIYPNLAKKYELYGVSKTDYIAACLDISATDDICENAIEIFNNIQEQLQDELDERAYNEEWRKAGQVSFGIGDSLKNAASNAAHGIAKSSGDASSRDKANSRKNKLYNDIKEPLWNAIKDSIFATITNYQTFVNEHMPDSIISYFDTEQSYAYLENAKNIEAKREELLVEAFRKCPWNYEVYKYIFEQYSFERRNILEIAATYDVNLTKVVNTILRSEYSSKAKANEELAIKAKAKVYALMNEWGIKDSPVIDEIENDCLDRLTVDVENADEARCNEIKGQLEKYDALERNKKKYFQKITERIEGIWAKEDGEIFDNYLMNTNILSSSEIQKGVSLVQERGRTAEAKKYLTAFQTCSKRENVSKARTYQALNKKESVLSLLKYIGYVIISLGVILMLVVGFSESLDEDSASTLAWSGIIFIAIGAIYQYGISKLKKIWEIITVNGTVINPALTMSKKEFEELSLAATSIDVKSHIESAKNQSNPSEENTKYEE